MEQNLVTTIKSQTMPFIVVPGISGMSSTSSTSTPRMVVVVLSWVSFDKVLVDINVSASARNKK